MKKILLILCSVLLLTFTGCNSMPDQIDKIIIENESVVVGVGQTVKLKVKIEPSNAIANELIMTSSNEEIAVINGMGEVVGKSVGETEIKICAKRGNACTTKIVKVVENEVKDK